MTRSVAIVQAAFVFPSLALCAVLSFLARETLGATVMALISFSWLANGLIGRRPRLSPRTPPRTS